MLFSVARGKVSEGVDFSKSICVCTHLSVNLSYGANKLSHHRQ